MSSELINMSTGEIMDGEILTGDPVKNPSKSSKSPSREDSDFVKLYRHFIAQIADLGAENATALRVFLFLVKHMDGMNAIGVPQKLIAEMLGISRQTVNAATGYLEQNGWLEIYKLGKSNIYVINPEVVWTSYATQKEYCKFTGAIMLSSEDQWELGRSKKTQVKYLDPLTIRRMADAEFPDDPTEGRQMTIEDFPEAMPNG